MLEILRPDFWLMDMYQHFRWQQELYALLVACNNFLAKEKARKSGPFFTKSKFFVCGRY